MSIAEMSLREENTRVAHLERNFATEFEKERQPIAERLETSKAAS